MNLFSKAKDLFDGGKKEDLIDHVPKEDLIDHVRRGDVDYIKTVDKKLLLKARDKEQNTGLLIATNMGNLDLCKEILKKCPSLLYTENYSNRTVLHQATEISFISCENFLFIDFFVSTGLNQIATSNEGDIYMKFKRWMKMQDLKGDTALVIAARYGNLHVVKRLVEVDRQYNFGLSKVVGGGGQTALKWAVHREDLEMVKLLTDEGDPYSDFVPFSTAKDLFQHVSNGDLDYIKTVELNVLLNSRDKYRMSALCIATKCDQLDCCKEILKRCPSLLYHQNYNKWSVLHHAAKQTNDRLIDLFVSAGLEAARGTGGTENIRFKKWINLHDNFGNTALISAVNTRNDHIVKTFAEVDRQYKLEQSEIVDSQKQTALQYEDHEMIKTLSRNIPISITMQHAQESLQTGNSSGTEVVSETNIFTFAEGLKHNNLKDSWPLNDKVNDVTKFLGDHAGGQKKAMDLFDGGKKEAHLINHVWKGDVDYIKTVDQKVLLKARDENGNTVLWIATNMGNLDLCKEILKKCPSLLYHADNYNKTVLHQATDPSYPGENFLFIDFFVGVGVDDLEANKGDIYMKLKRWMKMQNLKGDTALVIAACYGNLHVVKRFVEVDRQYNLGLSKVVGNEGKTALDCAVENEDHEMVKLLTDEGDPYSDFIPFSTVMDLFGRLRREDLVLSIKTAELNVLLNSRDQKRNSVLCIATNWDQLDGCKAILKRCPSLLYHQNNDKWTVLHHAAYKKNYRLIDFYVSAGLEDAKSEGGTNSMIRFKKWVNLKNRSGGNTALILAVIRGSRDIVKRFAEVDREYKLELSEIVGSNKRTALKWAMHYKDHQMIKTLTGSGDPNCSGAGAASESNILTFAEVSKHNNLKEHEMIKTLTGRGDPNLDYGAKSDYGNISISIAMQQAQESLQPAKSSGTGVTMMDKYYVEVCDSITSSLRKLASDKPQPYSRDQLKEFTKDFSQPLGFGGFGDVFKGQFHDGVLIAVKVLKNIEFKEKVLEEQFVAEVDTMGRAYHRNLIKLYGYCYETNTKFKALVYDYMENGSLDRILFEKKLDIPWAKLHNIAKEIAQGISYLHESCYPQIIHQDIKPANVLLDSNLSPKVIDFGLAKVNTGESQFEQTKIKGSRDYMAPEVNQPEQVKLSCKVDVYSFGKMLFDILGSKRNHIDKSGFPGHVWEKYKINQLDKFLLECGIKEEDKESAKRLAIIALLCVEHNPRARPMLSSVVKMLEGEIKLDTPVAPFYPNYYSRESSLKSDSRDY